MPFTFDDPLLAFDDPIATFDGGLVMDEAIIRLLREQLELRKIHGLVVGTPLVVSATDRTAGDITQTIATDGTGTTTVTRT